jgi:hypothetical protein
MTMSFDRPGLPHPGHKANEVEIDEALSEDGVDLTDGDLDGLDRPGAVSEGPVPNPPRRPGDAIAAEPVSEGEPAAGVPAYEVVGEADEPVDDPAHEDPASDPQP